MPTSGPGSLNRLTVSSRHRALCVECRSVFGERGAQLGLVLKLGFARELREGRESFAETLVQEENHVAAWGGVGLEQGTFSLQQTLVLLYQVTAMFTVAVQLTLQKCFPPSVALYHAHGILIFPVFASKLKQFLCFIM